jgi:peptide/nickel transport system permease protein
MLAFIVRRVLVSIPVLLLASFAGFYMVASSGDPLQELAQNPRISRETIERRAEELRLNDPVVERYGAWLGSAVRLDFGVDNNGNDVWPQLKRALATTARLVIIAELLAIGFAVLLGTRSALKQYSLFDNVSTFGAFLAFSLPVFWLAVLMKEFLAIRLNNLLGGTYVYTIGAESPGFRGGFWEKMADWAGHMVLPVVALAIISIAQYSRYLRASMLDVLSSDYVRTARAKGLTERLVTRRHARRNALIPLATVVSLNLGLVIGGAIVTEQVFQWRGMGTMLIRGIGQSDVAVVQAWLLVVAVVVILFNLIADICYAYLDPRIRLD